MGREGDGAEMGWDGEVVELALRRKCCVVERVGVAFEVRTRGSRVRTTQMILYWWDGKGRLSITWSSRDRGVEAERLSTRTPSTDTSVLDLEHFASVASKQQIFR